MTKNRKLFTVSGFHNVSVDYLLERTDNPKINKSKSADLADLLFCLFYSAVGEAGYEGIHFLFRAYIVGLVQDVLLLGF